MALTEIRIRTAKTAEKAYKLADGEGLYLLVHPNGSKYWRLKYRLGGKEKVYSIGIYPEVSLAAAREEKYRVRKMLKAGDNPSERKKIVLREEKTKANNNFESVMLEWHSNNLNRWSAKWAATIKRSLEKDVVPMIGHRQISEIKPMDILEIMRKIEEREAFDATTWTLSLCSQIFRYGISVGRCDYDVTVGIGNALVFHKKGSFKCIEIADFPKLLKDIENHKCEALTKYALKLMTLTFVRTGELRFATWSEIDFGNKEWRISGDRMKMGEQHIVPLAKQAISILKEIRSLEYDSKFIFPNINFPGKTINAHRMLHALHDMGYKGKMTVHGFRQLASTILNEKGFNSDAIERQLAHAERNKVRRAYNHAQYLPERREMMQWWADHITGLTHEW